MTAGFSPPPYPYDRLEHVEKLAAEHEGGVVDLSIGTPCDPADTAVIAALGKSGAEHGYPYSIGSLALRQAASRWLARELGVDVAPQAVAASVGTKEFVATTPQWLKLRDPTRDTVLYPAVSYPTYEMGAVLAGCRAVAVPVDDQWRIDLGAISPDDAARALCLWVNSPANPTGAVEDLRVAAAWGRAQGVPVLSDECYVEFTWTGPRGTILADGPDGVLAVHSLSKRSNLAGLRVGFYAGDAELVHYLSEVRKHAGFLVPGPVQHAAVVALDDQGHVERQRQRYRERLVFFCDVLASMGVEATLPPGGFYLWVRAPDDDAWAFAELMGREGGCLISPGDFYGASGAAYVRIAMVQPMDRLELVARRIAS